MSKAVTDSLFFMVYPNIFTLVSQENFSYCADDFRDITHPKQITHLREKFPHLPVNEVITIVKLQNVYFNKLKICKNWILTEKNAQQASSFGLAKYHGELFQSYSIIADLCCGIGMDLYFLSNNNSKVYAVEMDKEILAYCHYNMKQSEKTNITFIEGKAEDFKLPVEAYFIDPDRRDQQKRLIHPDMLSPNLTELLTGHLKDQTLAVKLSPATDYEQYPHFQKGTLHFVSEKSELKEILFCQGHLAESHARKAVVLPQYEIIVPDLSDQEVEITPIKRYLFEPDPAVIRSHLIQDYARRYHLTRIDEHLALLTSDNLVDTPSGKWYQVDDIFSFDRKKLNQYLKEKQIGVLDIKTRGFSETVESFRKKIKLSGPNQAVLFILKIKHLHYFVFAK